MSTIWYCVNCGYEATAGGRCHQCHDRLWPSALPEMTPDSSFEDADVSLADLDDEDRGQLIVWLNELKLLHRFEADSLVVDASETEQAEGLVRAIRNGEQRAGQGAGTDTETEVPPGWYRNPDQTVSLRYWDGERWTSDVWAQSPLPGRPPS